MTTQVTPAEIIGQRLRNIGDSELRDLGILVSGTIPVGHLGGFTIGEEYSLNPNKFKEQLAESGIPVLEKIAEGLGLLFAGKFQRLDYVPASEAEYQQSRSNAITDFVKEHYPERRDKLAATEYLAIARMTVLTLPVLNT